MTNWLCLTLKYEDLFSKKKKKNLKIFGHAVTWIRMGLHQSLPGWAWNGIKIWYLTGGRHNGIFVNKYKSLDLILLDHIIQSTALRGQLPRGGPMAQVAFTWFFFPSQPRPPIERKDFRPKKKKKKNWKKRQIIDCCVNEGDGLNWRKYYGFSFLRFLKS